MTLLMTSKINLHNVFYVLILSHNLISIETMTYNNKVVIFRNKLYLILDKKYNKKLIIIGIKNLKNKIYQFYDNTLDFEAFEAN